MTFPTPRPMSRRYLLSTGLAAAAAASVLRPRFAAASAARAESGPAAALAFDGPDVIAATGAGAGLLRLTAAGGEAIATADARALATHPARPGRIFMALRDGGLRHSGDGGRSWNAVDAGLPQAPILSITAAAHEPDWLYASVQGDGLWRSQDAGATWEFVMDRPYLSGAERDVLGLVSVGSETGMGGIWLYAGTEAGLTRVPDCFCRWQDVVAGDAMDALVAGKTPPAANPLPADEPVATLALAPDAPERIYAGLASGLWSSADGGVDWALASSGAIGALAVDPTDPLHLVASRDGGIAASRDGGATWTDTTFSTEN